MKRSWMAGAVAAVAVAIGLGGIGGQTAEAGGRSFGFYYGDGPRYSRGHVVRHHRVYRPRPVYVAPRPVYVRPRPVYVAPRPVYISPAPVYVGRPCYGYDRDVDIDIDIDIDD